MARGRKNEEAEERIDPFEAGDNDAAEVLLEFITQVEEEQQVIADSQEKIREIMREAGGRGYNTKIIRRVIAARKAKRQNAARYMTEQSEFETYMNALGLGDY